MPKMTYLLLILSILANIVSCKAMDRIEYESQAKHLVDTYAKNYNTGI